MAENKRVKQIVIISGKGGTGKTIIAGAFAGLAEDKVMADCDVDAADLHLLLEPEIKESHIFKSGVTAFTDKEKCIDCGICSDICRFDAIREDFTIDNISCEGCAFCSRVCPVNAIEMREKVSGSWFISDTRFGPLVHARLSVAEENSGKLVTLVRQKAKEIAEERNFQWVIIDGSPGIGCPVIASITGVDCAVIVVEPTLSGLHDAERVVDVTMHFNIPTKAIINKYDLNYDITTKIENWFINKNIGILGRVVFDKSVVESVVNGKTVVECSNSRVIEAVRDIWENLKKDLKKQS